MSKSTPKYWADRLDDVAQSVANRSIEEITAAQGKVYRQALREIDAQLTALYERIQRDGEMTPLSLYKEGRFRSMQRQIKSELKLLSEHQIKRIESGLDSATREAYKQTAAQFSVSFDRISKDFVAQVVNSKWSGDYFSNRIWDNMEALARNIGKEVVNCVVAGRNKDTAITQIRNSTEKAFYQCDRIVRTEVMHCINRAQGEIYRKAGATQYEVLVAHDERTCPICSAMSGKTFRFSDMQEGINYPVFHPNCRCTVIPVINPTVSKNMTAMPEHGTITPDDQAAILDYISSFGYQINAKLRGGITLSDRERDFVENMDRALKKMPVYQGTVYRSVSDFGIEDIDAFLQQYQVGKEYSFPAYTSSGTKVYDEDFPIQYVISSKSGRDLRQYNAAESEILFSRNARFRVTQVNHHTIYMEEV